MEVLVADNQTGGIYEPGGEEALAITEPAARLVPPDLEISRGDFLAVTPDPKASTRRTCPWQARRK